MEQNSVFDGLDIIPNPTSLQETDDNITESDSLEDQEVDQEEDDAIEEDVIEETDSEEDDSEITPDQFAYNYWVENEFIEPLQEGEELSPELLQEKLSQAVTNKMDEYLNNMHPEILRIMQFAHNISDLPDFHERMKDYYSLYQETESNDDIDPKEYWKRHAINTLKMDEDDAEDFVADLEDKGKLEQAVERLKKEEEERRIAQLNEIEQQEALSKQERQAVLEQFQNEMTSYLNEQPWQNTRKSMVVDALKNIQTLSSQISSSPKALVQLADVFTYFDPKTGELNFDALIEERAKNYTSTKKKKNIAKDSFSSSLDRIKGRSSAVQKGKTIQPQIILNE